MLLIMTVIGGLLATNSIALIDVQNLVQIYCQSKLGINSIFQLVLEICIFTKRFPFYITFIIYDKIVMFVRPFYRSGFSLYVLT